VPPAKPGKSKKAKPKEAIPERLADNGREPSWSPDGHTVTFASGGGIHATPANYSWVSYVVREEALDAYPSWSPDSSQIVFRTYGLGGFGLDLMNPDGTNRQHLTIDEATDDHPVFGRDGQRIFFISNRATGPASQVYQIFSMNRDGTDIVQLTNHPSGARNPSTRLARTAPIGENDNYTMKLKRGKKPAAPLLIKTPGVLANDVPLDGRPLTVELAYSPVSGSVILNPDGSFSYTPPVLGMALPNDNFAYRVSDGVTRSGMTIVRIWFKK
jgi:Tol biopolymer transport system component